MATPKTALLEAPVRKTRRTATESGEAPVKAKAAKAPAAPAVRKAPAPAARSKKPGVAAPAKRAAKSSNPGDPAAVSPELRLDMIREAAYFLAEQRGFAGEDPVQDWVTAEQAIDRRLREAGIRAQAAPELS